MDKLSISDAIGQIANERGTEILKTPKILMSIVMDYVQGYDKEKRLLKIALQHNVFESAYEIHLQSDDAQKEILQKKMESHLINDSFLSEENARIVITTILAGIGEKILLPELQRTAIESTSDVQAATETEIQAAPIDGEAEKLYQKGYACEKGLGVNPNGSTAVNYYMEAAEKGHPIAQYKIAQCYKLGDVLEKNNVKAASWYKKSALQGYAPSQHELGALYSKGIGVPMDETQSQFWIEKAATQGYAISQACMAFCYRYGFRAERDLTKAFEWFKKAAEQGWMPAEKGLAEMYEHGHGTSKNLPEAFRWYKEAAEQGDAEAQYRLFLCYGKGLGTTKDIRAAYSWLEKAAKQNHMEAQYEAGLYYYGQKNYAEAVKYFEKPASQGYVEAQFRLGWCYTTGNGVQQDYQKAVAFYKQAIAKDHAIAKNNLGVCYANGWGVAQDANMAFKLYKEAADQGDALGQANVASFYEKGIGTAKNISEALKWYQKAADQGNTGAKEALARLAQQPHDFSSVSIHLKHSWSPLSPAGGSPYVIKIGNQATVKLISGKADSFGKAEVPTGEHKISVSVYGYDDPNCLKAPIGTAKEQSIIVEKSRSYIIEITPSKFMGSPKIAVTTE